MATITPVTSADHDEWLVLWQGYLEFYETSLDDAVSEATFARLVDPHGNLHGAIARDASGSAIGLVNWLTHPATWTSADYCYLEDLYVSPDGRGAGAGRALIAHVREWAERHGAAKLYWLTAETNATARALYDKVATRSGMIHYQVDLG